MALSRAVSEIFNVEKCRDLVPKTHRFRNNDNDNFEIKKIIKSHKTLYFTPLPRSPPWTDFYQIWNKHSSRGRN